MKFFLFNGRNPPQQPLLSRILRKYLIKINIKILFIRKPWSLNKSNYKRPGFYKQGKPESDDCKLYAIFTNK